MKFKQKMLILCCVPLLMLTVVSLAVGLFQFYSGIYEQTKNSLKSSALAAMNLYNSQGYGDYKRQADGDVWRGMNFNVSEEMSVVDDLKDQIGVDITFFYQDEAIVTSICDENNNRWIGMRAGENIKKYTLSQGAQLWYKNIEIDQKMCHAYIIPITQSSNGAVIGALMASEPTGAVQAVIRRYILLSILISGVILAVVAGFIFRYIGGLTKVLHDVRRVLLKVSNGDLSDERLKVTNRKDEFGELATGTEKLRVKIANMLSDIGTGTEKLAQAVERLNDTSDGTTKAAEEVNSSVDQINLTAVSQNDQTQNAAHDVELTKKAIELMLLRINEINEISGEMAGQARESCEILAQLMQSSQESQQTVSAISEQVAITNESVQEIESVTEYITNIADETNLLALNASIEAARAGEAGRGFAVVAQQIQKLAEESNNSAIKIGKNIQSLVIKTDGIVAAMNDVKTALETQEENERRTKLIFDQLNKNIISLTDKEASMQRNISSMNSAKDHMEDIITTLADSAKKNADVSENTADVTSQMMREIKGLALLTSDLTELADNLNKNVDAFLS